MNGVPVSQEQALVAARRVALADLQRAECHIMMLAGWTGPFARDEWRCPLSGKFFELHEAIAEIRKEVNHWRPDPGEEIA